MYVLLYYLTQNKSFCKLQSTRYLVIREKNPLIIQWLKQRRSAKVMMSAFFYKFSYLSNSCAPHYHLIDHLRSYN